MSPTSLSSSRDRNKYGGTRRRSINFFIGCSLCCYDAIYRRVLLLVCSTNHIRHICFCHERTTTFVRFCFIPCYLTLNYSKPLIQKKDWIELLLFKKMKAKYFSGGHLSRTQKAAGPGEESMRNDPAWIVKCTFKDFRTTWR